MPKAILKSSEEIALLLTLRAAKTAEGRKVAAKVLARIELAMAEAEFAAEMAEASRHSV